jgi:hypothetical protein
MAGQNRTNWRCNFARRQSGGGDLVEQRLESVVIFPVNHRNLNWKFGESSGCGQAPEAGSYDYDARSEIIFHHSYIEVAKFQRVQGFQEKVSKFQGKVTIRVAATVAGLVTRLRV